MGVTSCYSKTTGGLNADAGFEHRVKQWRLAAHLSRTSVWNVDAGLNMVGSTTLWNNRCASVTTDVNAAECEGLAISLYKVDDKRVTHIVDLQAWLEQTAKSYIGQQNGHSCACSFFPLSLSLLSWHVHICIFSVVMMPIHSFLVCSSAVKLVANHTANSIYKWCLYFTISQ